MSIASGSCVTAIQTNLVLCYLQVDLISEGDLMPELCILVQVRACIPPPLLLPTAHVHQTLDASGFTVADGADQSSLVNVGLYVQ